jgi:hypothetical protein
VSQCFAQAGADDEAAVGLDYAGRHYFRSLKTWEGQKRVTCRPRLTLAMNRQGVLHGWLLRFIYKPVISTYKSRSEIAEVEGDAAAAAASCLQQTGVPDPPGVPASQGRRIPVSKAWKSRNPCLDIHSGTRAVWEIAGGFNWLSS